MNIPLQAALTDVQSLPDQRGLRIDAVGIKGLRFPVQIREGASCQSTVATFSMTVELPGDVKGTHMSRFIELLEAQTQAFEETTFRRMCLDMLERLGARRGVVDMRFPFFVRKKAPVSGVESVVDYEVTWHGRSSDSGDCSQIVEVVVPVTSLCPCSKEISQYGAHNQRSHISISAESLGGLLVQELIDVAERSASCEIYGLLKRPDEKRVTERAYDNPRFVEDLVREAAQLLRDNPRIAGFEVQAENFESIHNHSAFAAITSGCEGPYRTLFDEV
jgi:GTP cyclohydrolase I